ncbi:MAG TPA: hypothetical protein VI819_03225 [Patescibacteria group bacterium]|nr:hypothetical protein [Patescibacteria group bacterium]
MGIIKEAAIFIGDHITQPIRAKIASRRIGRPVYIERVVTHGLLEDMLDLDTKRVNWYIRTKDKEEK